MEQISIGEILEATGGTLLGDSQNTEAAVENTEAAAGNIEAAVKDIETDSRVAKAGDLFFALIGERMDGHRFVKMALENGAEGAVVSREPAAEEIVPGKFYVLVEDTTRALGDLARYYRGKFKIPVVGITGSVGKTTTKDMIAAVLAQKYRVLKTQGNFNNNIGLPKTIFRLDRSHEIAVLEMGMNHMGEIDYLVKIARPDVAVITNVGQSHIGNLGSQANIFRAKCEIFHGLAHGGTAVLNGDDRFLTTLKPGAEQISGVGQISGTGQISGAEQNPDTGGQDAFRTLYSDIAAGDYTFHWVGESAGCDFRAERIEDTLPDRMRFEAVMPPAGSVKDGVSSADADTAFSGEKYAGVIGTETGDAGRKHTEVIGTEGAGPNHEVLSCADEGESGKKNMAAAGTGEADNESCPEVSQIPDRLGLEVPALGRHMLYPVLTAAAVGRHFGLTDDQIRDGVASFGESRTKMRMETEKCANGITLLNDTYNANPQSMKAGLDILAKTGAAHRVAVVGDMLELEPFAEKLHREVGDYAAGLDIDTLVTVGHNAAYLAEAASQGGLEDVRPCEDKEQAKEQLRELVQPDTTLLFKASRGMALEELCAYCRELAGRDR